MHPPLRRSDGVALAAALGALLAACAPDSSTALDPSGRGPLFHGDDTPPGTTRLAVTKTASGYWETRTDFNWTLTKTVTPASAEVGPGGSVTFHYSLTATRTPSAATEGKGVRGEICVTNEGPAATEGLAASDAVQRSSDGTTWSTVFIQPVSVAARPTLAPGESHCYPYDFAVAFNPAYQYRNVALVTVTNNADSTEPSGDKWVTAFSAPASPDAVETDGDADLTDLLTCPAGFSCTPSSGGWSLAGTQSIGYDVDVANVSAPCGSTADAPNVATLTEGSSGEERTAEASVTVTTPACAPSLTLVKTADVQSEEAGNPIGFTLVLTNAGPGTAEGVTISDPLPAGSGISWSLATPVTGCTVTGGLLECSLGDLPAGASATISLVSPTTAASCGTYTNTASASASNHPTVTGTAVIDVRCLPPPSTGSQGCTPGYWKQKNHFANWIGYVPTGTSASRYDAVFGVSLFGDDTTLLDALGQGGGNQWRLGRHSTAALLNAATDGVDYGMTTAQVIAAVQAAVASGMYDTASDVFEKLNERGCPLGR